MTALPADPVTWGTEVGLLLEASGIAPLMPWQAALVDQASTVAGGAFVHDRVTVLAPRRNGKTRLVTARALAGLLLWGERSVLYTAHLGDTARATFDAFLDLIDGSPVLKRRVSSVMLGKGSEAVTFSNGATFSIRARTNKGGRGLECDTLILDEALELSSDHVAALAPTRATAAAQGRGQTWVLSSAGHAGSEVLATIAAAGRTGEPGHLFREYAAPADANYDDPATWAHANPALGHTLSENFLRGQRQLMSDEDFAREHLGKWSSDKGRPFLPPGSWEVLTADSIPPGLNAQHTVLALEHSREGAALVAAVPGLEGNVWVEVLRTWPPGVTAEEIAAQVLAVKPPAIRLVADDFTTTNAATILARHMPVQLLNIKACRLSMDRFREAVIAGRVHHNGSPAFTQLHTVESMRVGDDGLRMSRKDSPGPTFVAFATCYAVAAASEPAQAAPVIRA